MTGWHIAQSITRRVALMAAWGGIANACAGAVLGPLTALALWGVLRFNALPSYDVLSALVGGLYTGALLGLFCGGAALALASALNALKPRWRSSEMEFFVLFLGLMKGSVTCLVFAFCGMMLAVFVAANSGDVAWQKTLRFYGATACILWLLSSYVFGAFFGALAPRAMNKILSAWRELHERVDEFWRRLFAHNVVE
jgi:MFS family permease